MPHLLLRALTAALLTPGLLLALPTTAWAEKVIWQYDSLPSDMNDLANGLKNHPVGAHPGFVQGEAFGQIYKPKASDYPIKILTVELVMAQPDSAPKGKTIGATIEIWNDDSAGPAPKSTAPLWSINTADFANGGTIGMPIVGNTGMVYQFDWSKPEGHPPEITAGNIFVMIRINNSAKDLSTYWGSAASPKLECMAVEISGFTLGCGCQELAALTDQATTVGANVMHIVWPLGTCSGNKQWKFVEQLTNEAGFTMKGDFILRLGVDGTAPIIAVDAGPTGSDTSSAPDAGSTLDTAATPDTVATVDVSSQPDVPADVPAPDVPLDVPAVPVKPPSIEYVTPAKVFADKASSIEIGGQGFHQGAIVKLIGAEGSDTLANVKVAAAGTSIEGTVAGFKPGTYDIKVTNPDGQAAVKTGALLIAAADTVHPDAGGTADSGASTADFTLVSFATACVDTAKDTDVTVLGSGFVQGMTLRIGTTELQAVEVSASGVKATAIALKGIPAGTYTLFAELPDHKATKTLANAVHVGVCGSVVASSGGQKASGCAAAPAPISRSALGLLLLAGVAVFARRRLARR